MSSQPKMPIVLWIKNPCLDHIVFAKIHKKYHGSCEMIDVWIIALAKYKNILKSAVSDYTMRHQQLLQTI